MGTRVTSIVIERILDESEPSLLDSLVTPSPSANGTLVQLKSARIDDTVAFQKMVQSASKVVSRRQVFRTKLEDWVGSYHSMFLAEKGDESSSKLEWHPDFTIELVPVVPQAVLPRFEMPHLDKLKMKAGFELPGLSAFYNSKPSHESSQQPAKQNKNPEVDTPIEKQQPNHQKPKLTRAAAILERVTKFYDIKNILYT